MAGAPGRVGLVRHASSRAFLSRGWMSARERRYGDAKKARASASVVAAVLLWRSRSVSGTPENSTTDSLPFPSRSWRARERGSIGGFVGILCPCD